MPGTANILDILIEKKAGGGIKKDSKYGLTSSLKIPAWQFEGRGVTEGQRYTVTFGRKGLITLRPVADESA